MKKAKKRTGIFRTLAHALVGISDLKRDPAGVFEAADGGTLLVMNYSSLVAYIVPLETWERVVDAIREAQKCEEVSDLFFGIALP
jgi:antitoxin StbD